ncbi:MAG: protein kinase [Planctomycetes bacterium]|nr:protein kinase [Planctomycetota bacterium]
MPTPQITGYEVLGTLSDGTTSGSTLYKAWQTNLKRYVALRVLDEEEGDDLDYLKRFRDEAHAAMDIRQRNVVSTLDQGTCPETGLHYVAYEYVKGPNLQKVLQGVGSLNEEEAVALAHGVSLALCSLERAHLVHGEVSPAKVLLAEDGVPKLAEVGLARRLGGLGSPYLERGPEFVSPEQALGLSCLDSRADLFALGVTLYRLLTGSYPFKGEEAFEIVTQNINADLPDPRGIKPELNPGLSKVIGALTARDPDERYPSAEAAAFDLARLRSGLDVLGPSASESAIASGQAPPNLSESKVLKVLLSESAARRELKQSNGKLGLAGSADDPPRAFKVRVYTGDVQLNERRFDQDVVVIGRAVGCDVQIDNPIVSRKHVEIRRRGGTFALVAHRTTNGTTVNGTQVKEAHALRLDERIVVSDKFRLEILLEAPGRDETDIGTIAANEQDDEDALATARERDGTSRTTLPVEAADKPAPLALDDTPVDGTRRQLDDPPTEQQLRREPKEPEPAKDPAPAKDPTPLKEPTPPEELEVPAFARRGSARVAREHRRAPRATSDAPALTEPALPRAYLSGEVEGVQVRTPVDKILQVGKAEGCTFTLPGTFAPRKAALVVPFGGAFHLVNVAPAPDALLRNGTPVDDMVALQSGDTIEIGKLKLTFELS